MRGRLGQNVSEIDTKSTKTHTLIYCFTQIFNRKSFQEGYLMAVEHTEGDGKDTKSTKTHTLITILHKL
jgi:hypothetical protein